MSWIVFEILESGSPKMLDSRWSIKNAYAAAEKLREKYPNKAIEVESGRQYTERLADCARIDKEIGPIDF